MIAIIVRTFELLDTSNDLKELLQASLGRQYSLHPRIDLSGEIHRPSECFKAGLDDVVRILAAWYIDMQVHAQLIGKGGEKLMGQVGVEIADTSWANLDVVGEIRPAAQIDYHLGERLVERAAGFAEAANTCLVAESLFERLSQSQPDIFDRVVIIDFQIALGLNI